MSGSPGVLVAMRDAVGRLPDSHAGPLDEACIVVSEMMEAAQQLLDAPPLSAEEVNAAARLLAILGRARGETA